MLVVPAVAEVARPAVPASLLIVAVAMLLDDQVTAVVRFCIVWSVYVPVATNCCLMPIPPMLGVPGLIWIDCRMLFCAPLLGDELPPEPLPQAIANRLNTNGVNIDSARGLRTGVRAADHL
jgi:hypothetical protein